MNDKKIKYLLTNKLVCDFRGIPIGRVKKLWVDDAQGPLVIVEHDKKHPSLSTWEAIPLREIDSIRDEIRLKPPVFAE